MIVGERKRRRTDGVGDVGGGGKYDVEDAEGPPPCDDDPVDLGEACPDGDQGR